MIYYSEFCVALAYTYARENGRLSFIIRCGPSWLVESRF